MSSAPVDDLQSVVRGGPARGGFGDRVFRSLAIAAGVVILATLAGVALFLVVKAYPAITAGADEIPGGEGLFKFIWPLVFGTIVAATIAVVSPFRWRSRSRCSSATSRRGGSRSR